MYSPFPEVQTLPTLMLLASPCCVCCVCFHCAYVFSHKEGSSLAHLNSAVSLEVIHKCTGLCRSSFQGLGTPYILLLCCLLPLSSTNVMTSTCTVVQAHEANQSRTSFSSKYHWDPAVSPFMEGPQIQSWCCAITVGQQETPLKNMPLIQR